jgi:hypothetical protein
MDEGLAFTTVTVPLGAVTMNRMLSATPRAAPILADRVTPQELLELS